MDEQSVIPGGKSGEALQNTAAQGPMIPEAEIEISITEPST